MVYPRTRFALLLLSVLALGAVAACTSDDPDPVGPAAPIAVAFSSSDTAVVAIPTLFPDGETKPACHITVTVKLSGGADGASITWTRGAFEFRVLETQTLRGGANFDGTKVAELFGQASTTWTSPGEVVMKQFFLADQALSIFMFFEYTTSEGVVDKGFVPFNCYPS